MTTTKNIQFHRGETWRMDVTFKGPNNTTLPIIPGDGDQVTFRMVRGSTILMKLTLGDGVTLLNGPAGTASIVITDSRQDTALIPDVDRDYKYECFYSSPLRGDSVQIKGTFKVLKSLKEAFP
jgi:hypothetical protein